MYTVYTEEAIQDDKMSGGGVGVYLGVTQLVREEREVEIQLLQISRVVLQ